MNPPRFAFELDFLELTDHVPGLWATRGCRAT
jgi:hypothetical protein